MSFARQLRRHAIELGAVLFLVVCASRGRRLRAGPPARALPVAARLHDQGGLHVGRGGRARAGADRRRRRREGRRDRQGHGARRPRADRAADPPRQAARRLRQRARAAAPEDRAAGHVGRPRPGDVAARASSPTATCCRSRRRCRTCTWTRSCRRSTRTRARGCRRCSQAGGRGLDGQAGNLRALFKAGAPTLKLQPAADRRDQRPAARAGAAGPQPARAAARGRRAGRRHPLAGERRRGDVLGARAPRRRAAHVAGPAAGDARGRARRARGGAAVRARPRRRRCARSSRRSATSTRCCRRSTRCCATRARRRSGSAGSSTRRCPVAGDLRPALSNLNAVTPHLSKAFTVLNYVVNELGYNPPGPEEGYLFWTAWFFHNADSILSIEDAQGVAWRGGLITSCSTLAGLPANAPGDGDADAAAPGLPEGREPLMVKQAPTPLKLAVMTVFALSCFGLLLFLWKAFGGPIAADAEGLPRPRRLPRGDAARRAGRRADLGRAGRQGRRARAARAAHRRDAPAELASTRRWRATRGRSCAPRRCWARPTSSCRPARAARRRSPRAARLPDAQVQPTTELDEVIRAFTPATRRDLKRFVIGHGGVAAGARPGPQRRRRQRRAAAARQRQPADDPRQPEAARCAARARHRRDVRRARAQPGRGAHARDRGRPAVRHDRRARRRPAADVAGCCRRSSTSCARR